MSPCSSLRIGRRIRPCIVATRPNISGEILVPTCEEQRKLDRPIPPGVARIQSALLRLTYRSALDAGDLATARKLYPALAIEVLLEELSSTPAGRSQQMRRPMPPPTSSEPDGLPG